MPVPCLLARRFAWHQLASRVCASTCAGRGYNFADETGVDLEGDGSHGTHCAGIASADSDNQIGIAGTAGGAAGKGVLTVGGASNVSSAAGLLSNEPIRPRPRAVYLSSVVL